MLLAQPSEYPGLVHLMFLKSITVTLLGSIQIYFVGNSADYGAAMFVDDDTYIRTCYRKLKAECFFQVIATGQTIELEPMFLQYSQNVARYSGSALYGELLDRCNIIEKKTD